MPKATTMYRMMAYVAVIIWFLSFSVQAQSLPGDPPLRKLVDERGIDLLSGTPQRKFPLISIGDTENGGLYLDGRFEGGASLNGWIDTGDGRSFFVILNDRNYAFINQSWYATSPTGPGIINGFSFVSAVANNATLRRDGDIWTFVSPIGEIATFTDALDRHLPETGNASSGRNQNLLGSRFVQLSSLVKPNGETIKFHNIVDNSNGFSYVRQVSVSNNYGYQIKTADPNITAINSAYDTCDPAAEACFGLQQARSTILAARNPGLNMTDAAGRTTAYTFSQATGLVANIALPSGRVQRTTDYKYVYSEGGYPQPQYVTMNRVKSWSNGSSTWTYDYADSDRATKTILTITDPAQNTRVIGITRGLSMYLASGISPSAPMIDSDTDELGRTVRYTYDNDNRVRSIRLPEGNSVAYEYDQWGNRTKVTWTPKPGSNLAAVVTVANHDANCPSQITCSYPAYAIDARGNRTDYTYDPVHGGVLTMTGPAPMASAPRPQTRYSYAALYAWYKNASGSLAQAPTPIYKLVGTSSCATGSTCVGAADETRTIISYGTPGTPNNLMPTVETKMSGDGAIISTKTMTYNAFGDVIAVDGPLPGSADTVRNYYDLVRQLTGSAEPDPDGPGPLKNLAKRTTHDPDGLPTLVERGAMNDGASDLNSFTAFDQSASSYDTVGRKVNDIKSGGGTTYTATQYSYDTNNRLICTAERMNPNAFSTAPADACVLGTEGVAGPDRITKNVYDTAGQLVQVRKAVGTSLEQAYGTYAHSPNGKLTDMIDANGNRAQMGYDGFDRQTRWSFPSTIRSSGYAPSTPANAFATAGAVSASDYEAYDYDAAGNRTSWRKRDGRTLAFTYDALNRMTTKVVPDGCAPIQVGGCPAASATRDVYYGYDLRGLQTFARFDGANGEGITNAYDALSRLSTSTTAMAGYGRTLGYQYDAAGNRTRITHPDGTFFTYDYDNLSRQTAIHENGGAIVATVTYDTQGRRSGDTRGGAASVYDYDAISRPISLSDDLAGTTKDVATTFTYNPAGQIVGKARSNDAYAYNGYVDAGRDYTVNGLNQYITAGSTAFAYDANGNLTGEGANVYIYDVENRLVSRSGGLALAYDPNGRLWQTSGGTSGTTSYLYDGDELVAEYGGAGNLRARYVHGPAEDDPILWYEGSGMGDRRSLQIDQQGSVVSIAGSGGTPLAINSYDEYGTPGSVDAGAGRRRITNVGRFQYTGQAWLPDLGMYHYKARIYSPTLGRFLQTDPIGYKDQNNLYAYVGNDPVNKTDPTGTYECTGSKSQCGAVEGAYNRAAAALKSDNLSKAERTKLQGALTALGKPGQANGVKVGFASGNSIARATNGRSDIGYTEQGKNGTVNVRLNSNFGSLYDSYRGKMFGKDFSRLSARDERSGIFAHEGRHVYQFRNGMTPESYSRDVQRFERDAKDTGKLINNAYGSTSIYDTPED